MDLGYLQRSMWWILNNQVDIEAAARFLALPSEAQENIRRGGMLWKADDFHRNTSAMLCKRIKSQVGFEYRYVAVPDWIRKLAIQLVTTQEVPLTFGEAPCDVKPQEFVLDPFAEIKEELLAGHMPPAKKARLTTNVTFRLHEPQSCFLQRPRVLALLRGHVRCGGPDHNAAMLKLEVFRENMQSIKTHLFNPLEKDGYKVSLIVDIQTDKRRIRETSQIIEDEFSEHVASTRDLQVCRVLPGQRDVEAVLESLDFVEEWYKHQLQKYTLEGMYILRADVRLLQQAPHFWRKDKLTFFWKSKWGKDESRANINDSLLYVPKGLFGVFRDVLHETALQHERRVSLNNLRWLAEHPLLTDHVDGYLNVFHASSTEMEQNPFYVMTGRALGNYNPGKWPQQNQVVK